MRTLFMGGDPGIHGGLCLMDRRGRIIALIPMPFNTFKTSPKKRKVKKGAPKNTPKKPAKPGNTSVVDEIGVKEFFQKHIKEGDVVYAGIEHITTLQPPVTRMTNFILGDAFGILKGACAVAGFSIHLIPSKVWQATAFPYRGSKADKAKSIALVRQQWPAVAHMLQTKSCDGPAESVLIANHLRITILGGNHA